jgi:hypothetical protein
MTTKGFSKQPSSGQSFESKSNGVSELPVGDPFEGQSMAGGNATTSRPPFGAEGSPSEGTALVMETAIHDFGDATQVHTPFDAPKTPTRHTDTKVSN